MGSYSTEIEDSVIIDYIDSICWQWCFRSFYFLLQIVVLQC